MWWLWVYVYWGGIEMSGYNGWANRETWNVALWLQNDERLYNGLRLWWGNTKRHTLDKVKTQVCLHFAALWRNRTRWPYEVPQDWEYWHTPDGIGLDDPAINWDEVFDCVKEFCIG
jgi:hypothetical protein